MSPSSDAPATLPRFSKGERWLHRSIGLLMLVLFATAALLFIPDLSGLIGNRPLVRLIHEIAGFALPVPLLLAFGSRAFRDDAGRLNRFTPSDWQWLRRRDRRSGLIPVGKFNAGQKLNAAFTLGAVIVMFGTGAMMFFSSLFPDALRTGATFVHDWLGLALIVVVCGHIYMALNDATARTGMRTGRVPVAWAQREHGTWADEATVSSTAVGARGVSETPAADDPFAGT